MLYKHLVLARSLSAFPLNIIISDKRNSKSTKQTGECFKRQTIIFCDNAMEEQLIYNFAQPQSFRQSFSRQTNAL